MALSTALSDAALCAVATACAVALPGDARAMRRLAALGFLLLAFSAGLGALRHAGWPELETMHRSASAAAAMIGMPLVPLALLLEAAREPGRIAALGLLALGAGWLLLQAEPAWRLASGLLAQTLWLALAWRWFGPHPAAAVCILAAVALTLFAGLVVGNQGTWAGLPRVDWLHYLLALAQLCLLAAIRLVLLPLPARGERAGVRGEPSHG